MDDFTSKYPSVFDEFLPGGIGVLPHVRLTGGRNRDEDGVLELVCWSDELAVSVMEKKGSIAFPMQFSRGFEMDKKSKKWEDEWQKLPYISPYEDASHLLPNSDDGDGCALDWKETQNAHVFKVDVLGLKKEEVKVEIKDGRVLQISGERSQDQEEKSDTCHHVERSSRRFSRRFRLSENSKVEEVKAAIENGVLTVIVPKEEVKRPNVRPIQILINLFRQN
nr:17.7 kda class i heat shock protein [Quercus suber]